MTTLEVGTEIEYYNSQGQWTKSIIYKVSNKFVWFKGSGFDRIAKQTFINYPQLYKTI